MVNILRANHKFKNRRTSERTSTKADEGKNTGGAGGGETGSRTSIKGVNNTKEKNSGIQETGKRSCVKGVCQRVRDCCGKKQDSKGSQNKLLQWFKKNSKDLNNKEETDSFGSESSSDDDE